MDMFHFFTLEQKRVGSRRVRQNVDSFLESSCRTAHSVGQRKATAAAGAAAQNVLPDLKDWRFARAMAAAHARCCAAMRLRATALPYGRGRFGWQNKSVRTYGSIS
jgi:hypothetical protein